MTVAIAALLLIGIAASWLGSFAALRLGPLDRLHSLAFVNVAAGAPITIAVWLGHGASASTAKLFLVWIVMLLAGALSAHVSARAIHLRGGERA